MSLCDENNSNSVLDHVSNVALDKERWNNMSNTKDNDVCMTFICQGGILFADAAVGEVGTGDGTGVISMELLPSSFLVKVSSISRTNF
jgi:hypothetical protein